MIKLSDVVYYSHNDVSDPNKVLDKHAPSLGFGDFIKDKVSIQFIKHMGYEGTIKNNEIDIIFFKRPNSFWQIPFKTHKYIKEQQPDIIIVEGLIFPIQLIALKKILKKRCKIIVQHHGEKPFKGVKKYFQKVADPYVDAYMFTSNGNAQVWIDKKIIKDINKCVEIPEASTYFFPLNRQESKAKLELLGNDNLLWVGRLNANKDPLTVLKAFGEYLKINSAAKLYMVYQTEELLPEIEKKISTNNLLRDAIILVGKKEHGELQEWYSAADFFVSGSHSEGSGYALLEAMSCGCIPIVTNIPSFNKITDNGNCGILYEPGNANDLYQKLVQLNKLSREEFCNKMLEHVKNKLSFKTIADQTYQLCQQLISK